MVQINSATDNLITNDAITSVNPILTATADEFRKFIEVEVLKVIRQINQQDDVARKKIQEIARITLELIKPGMQLDELYRNAIKLDDRYTELAPVVFRIISEYENKYHQKALQQVSQYIKNGQYDSAQDMVKKVLLYKLTN